MIYDYYDKEKYKSFLDEFYADISKSAASNGRLDGNTNPYWADDPYYAFLELALVDSDLGDKYQINESLYLYDLLLKCISLSSFPIGQRIFLKHPYIKKYSLSRDEKYLSTIFGDVSFKTLIGIKKIFAKGFSDLEQTKTLYDIYKGKTHKRCHELSIVFCNDFLVTTAFIPTAVVGLKYLHSFLERDDTVIDISNNLVMSSDDFYELTSPEVVTKIAGSDLIDMWNDLQSNPNLIDLGLKQLLVEYDDILQDPSGVKVRTFTRN